MPPGDPLGCDEGVGDDCPGCVAVDLLFVIDNSISMDDEQIALTLAFPGFADTILEALPDNVNVHIGITSTEMGYSPSGGYDPLNFCIGTGENGIGTATWAPSAVAITKAAVHTTRRPCSSVTTSWVAQWRTVPCCVVMPWISGWVSDSFDGQRDGIPAAETQRCEAGGRAAVLHRVE